MKRSAARLWVHMVVISVSFHPNHIHGFNLDLKNFTILSGPEDSYFGFSVDFYESTSKRVSVVVGAPRADSSQPGVSRGGAVFKCPWASGEEPCRALNFDQKGDENITFGKIHLMAHKSNQWLGASVRTFKNYILACAPMFHWNVVIDEEEAMNTPVGNCQLMDMETGEVAQYAPCRELYVEAIYNRGYPDRRYCVAGFSTDITESGRAVVGAPGGFYFQGQIITASLTHIMKSGGVFSPVHTVGGEMKTSQRRDYYDLYLGYSVAAGNFNEDNITDFLVGVPNDLHTRGSVKILNGATMSLQIMKSITGCQIASYFGHSVAVMDINKDGLDDILIGAPLFMEQLSTQKFREVGQVYVYIQGEGFTFSSRPEQRLTGTHTFGRFGSSVAPLGDIDHDGFNDVAVGAPGSEDGGQVFIFLGGRDGLTNQYVQVIESPFQTFSERAMFGFSLRGGTDMDDNGYPDLIVGAWGVSRAVTYRATAVVRTQAQLSFFPDLLNPEERTCQLHQSGTFVTCFIIMTCISVSGHRIPKNIDLVTELQMDRMKPNMARRTLLLSSNQPYANFQLSLEKNSGHVCRNFTAYLLPEFKDKLSPIFMSVKYSLADSQDAVLHGESVAVGQTRIILNCGSDNICIPDLKLKAIASTQPILIGDENPALLIIEAENLGEGSYETELHISPPAHTHYQGVVSNREDLSPLVCAQKKDNGSVVVICDLGNPMEGGHQLKAGLYFSTGGLEQVEDHITFQMQIRSKNSQSADSNLVLLEVVVEAAASLEMRGVSSPVDFVLPVAKWLQKDPPESLDEVGPLVEHVYELRNLGPSPVNAKLRLEFPVAQNGSYLLYVFANASEELLTCHTNYEAIDPHGIVKLESANVSTAHVHHFNKRDLSETPQSEQDRQQTSHVNCSAGECLVFECETRNLQRDERAVMRVLSRLWLHTFLQRPYVNYLLYSSAYYEVVNVPSKIQPAVLPRGRVEVRTGVIWRRPDGQDEVPVWWVVVAVTAGLLLLAGMSGIFWKVGFFKRNRPPSDADVDDTQRLNTDQADESDNRT